jgi:transcriptional regulator with XRE-family HTH domain
MKSTPDTPFADIGARLAWHRECMGWTQAEYAEAIGAKRAAYSHWETGLTRLSLNGAIALRKRHGLSLDFLFFGIDDALPMALRELWRKRAFEADHQTSREPDYRP